MKKEHAKNETTIQTETMKPIKPLTPLQAIKAWCFECSGHQSKERRLCPRKDCFLYPFRFGKNSNLKSIKLTEDQKNAIVARLTPTRKYRMLLFAQRGIIVKRSA